jgi:hypothetical protein
MRRILRTIEVAGPHGSVRGRAVIDTGTPRVIIPRSWAVPIGLLARPARSRTLAIGGSTQQAELRRASIRVIGAPGCAGLASVVVPSSDAPFTDRRTGEVFALVGSLFLQRRKASIDYGNRHAIRCRNPNVYLNEIDRDGMLSLGEYPTMEELAAAPPKLVVERLATPTSHGAWAVWRVTARGALEGAIPKSAAFPSGSVYRTKREALEALRRFQASA